MKMALIKGDEGLNENTRNSDYIAAVVACICHHPDRWS